METPAPKASQNVLITHIDSTLGANIARFYLSQNKNVYGISKKPPDEDVLENRNFTLCDIDMSQPFPAHLTNLELIVHLLPETAQTLKNFRGSPSLTGQTNNIISQAKNHEIRVILMAPLSTSDSFYESISQKVRGNLKLFLLGDIYGPNDNLTKSAIHIHHHIDKHFYESNELNNLISQAIFTDKVILEDEGSRIIVPTYIDDALIAFAKLADSQNKKNLNIIVSEGPKTALSIAYEIQKAAQLVLNKQLKLFFSGPQRVVTPQPQPVIRLEYLGFEPKVNLDEGLKKVFEAQNKNAHFREVKPKPDSQIEEQNQVVKASAIPIKAVVIEPKKSLTQPIAQKFAGFKTKRVFLALLLILVLTIVKTGLDFYLGISSLKGAKLALASGDFETMLTKSKSAEKSFNAAYTKYKLLSLPFTPIFGNKRKSFSYALTSASLGSGSLQFLAEGAKELSKNLKIITSTSGDEESADIEKANVNFKNAYLMSTQAYELAKTASGVKILSWGVGPLQQEFKDLSALSSSSLEFVNFIRDFTGGSGKKTYLVLLQNNAELRPGGGFIDSFGEITFENGHLKSFNFEDIYEIDSKLKEEIDAPRELTDKLGVAQLYLRDSNWSLDFSINSKTARDFYKKETGGEVDGVVAFDLTFIENLLEVLGPIKVEGYSGEISKDNLFAQSDLMPQITRALVDELIKSFSSTNGKDTENLNWLKALNTVRLALSGKHLLFSFDNQNLSSLVKTKAWDNALPPAFFDPAEESLGTRDFLALSEANLGANYANHYIERKIDYSMTVGRDADLTAKLKVTYTNTAKINTWPAGTYVNFLRVYAPAGSGLLDFQNGQTSDLSAVEVINQANLTVFSTFVEIPVGKTADAAFTYKIPKNIKLEQAPSYNLYIAKQPGTDKDPLTFTFNLPDNIEAKSVNGDQTFAAQKNIKIETNLSADRQFEINLKKK